MAAFCGMTGLNCQPPAPVLVVRPKLTSSEMGIYKQKIL